MALWIIAALAAYFVKGLCGFANTLVLSSILSFGVNNINISPVDLMLGMPGNCILAYRNRKSLRNDLWIPLSLLVLAGSLPGVFLLKNTDARIIKIIFGCAVIFTALEMLWRETHSSSGRSSRVFLVIIGILSGVLCGLFGVGALLAAYVGRTAKNQDEFKANISAVFIAENLFRIILYSANGIITAAAVRQALFMVPFMLAGLWLGMKSSSFLNEKTVKKCVIILLVISGALLILQNI